MYVLNWLIVWFLGTDCGLWGARIWCEWKINLRMRRTWKEYWWGAFHLAIRGNYMLYIHEYVFGRWYSSYDRQVLGSILEALAWRQEHHQETNMDNISGLSLLVFFFFRVHYLHFLITLHHIIKIKYVHANRSTLQFEFVDKTPQESENLKSMYILAVWKISPIS